MPAAPARAGTGQRRGVLRAALAAGLGIGPWAGALRAQGGGAEPQPLPELVARARAGVLPVGTWNATESPRFGFRGSGFVIGDGSLVVTNHHVLPAGLVFSSDGETGSQPVVMAARSENTGSFRRVRVLASDRTRDLALLQVLGAPLPNPLPLAEPGGAREGQAVLLMGFPIGGALGFSVVSHRGIVSSITSAALPAPTAGQLDARAVAALRRGSLELIQLDATAYPGNSGGPLLDAASGRVLGVVNMVLVKGTRESALASPTGISYAVPVAYLHELLQEAGIVPPAPR